MSAGPTMPPAAPLDAQCDRVLRALRGGRLVPFLGAGASVCGRPVGSSWKPNERFLPTGAELARHLADKYDCRLADHERSDLVRVSQYIELTEGSGVLFSELHGVFDGDYPATPLHQFLARLPQVLKSEGCRTPFQVVVTTNYDDLLERELKSNGLAFDVVTYMAHGDDRGKFWHLPSDGEPRVIDRPNEYTGVSPLHRPVIVKIHGAVMRTSGDGGLAAGGLPERESFVITEDHYIDYLTRTDISNLLPVTIASALRQSHFLFLGYSLRDWNLRVILHRLWGQQKLSYKSWAIQLNVHDLDQRYWLHRDVEIFEEPLDQYVVRLEKRLSSKAESPAPPPVRAAP